MTPKTKTRFVIILLLLLTSSSEGWRRRRRRRAPVPVNCVWGLWGSWGGCSAPCGNSGTRTRTRWVAQPPLHGGIGCTGPGSKTEPCNRFCYNGGTPFASHCACAGDYWNTCCDSACTPISHCASLSCSHGSNQQCGRCDGDYGVRGQAIQILLQATAGGNIHLYDRDSNSAVMVKYFTGFQGNHTADIIYDINAPGQGTPSHEHSTDIPWVLYGGLGAGVVIFLITTVAICCCCYCRKGQSDTRQTASPTSKSCYSNSAYNPDFDSRYQSPFASAPPVPVST
uniref:SMB domain-containing protein n=1 Tax=Branchiostoma floridae TaxID=7739 RepID=C3ZMV9_BRAFL|eukprot:XP_002590088.1 hypothetical protein BRAFLDRAFT_83358 [Branchiostoma floridae]